MLKSPGAYGRYTQTPLCDAADLLCPPREDAWGYVRLPYSPRLMRLATEIAAATYAFDFAPFFQSGWMDATLQVENRIFPHVDAYYAHKTPHEFIRSGMKLRRAKSMLSPSFTDILRAMRQLITTDTGKAVVMALPLDEDHFAIAISFMGTGRKFYDWFTNFKLSSRNGMHDGFLSTARLFDRNSERIAFPRVARALARSTLTLSDILNECTQPDSRFRLFLCGHSQGGAVAQAYCHLLHTEHAVSLAHVTGYTLGSPSAAGIDFPENPAQYPLYHLINEDDLVPRMGASMHLGVEMRFVPDDAFRRHVYPDSGNDDARFRMRAMLRSVQSMPDALLLLVATLRAVTHLPAYGDLTTGTLWAQLNRFIPALHTLGLRPADLAQVLEQRLLAACRTLSPEAADSPRLSLLEHEITDFIVQFGADVFSRCVEELCVAPHMLSYDHPAHEAPYQSIAARQLWLARPLLSTRDAQGTPSHLPPPGAWYPSPDSPLFFADFSPNSEKSP